VVLLARGGRLILTTMGKIERSAPASVPMRVRWLFAIFVVSGVCGLIYESIWSHYLKLFVGHAAYAQTVVLIVFIGGMALGAWLVGRVAHRIASPLVGYAIVEGVIGVISLAFHSLFVAATDWAYAVLLPAACVPESPCVAQWVFAALLILPQSILLGTTFPLMTSGVLRLAPRQPGRRIALLYFLNSIGAAGGVLLAGFVLIPTVGLPGALATAGLLNIAVAGAAYACARSGGEPAALEVAPWSTPASDVSRGVLILIAALTGLSSFIYEIIWIRMLAMVVGASTHAFELMLAAFILGLALGGLWVRKRVDRFRDLVVALAIVQVLMGIAAVATLAFYDGMFDLLSWLLQRLARTDGGYALYNLISHGFALAIMLPATFLAGMTFPLITTELLRGRDGERAIGYVYAANTLGSIVGVLIAVHFALPALGIKGGLLLGAGIDVALGVALFAMVRRRVGIGPLVRWSAGGVAALLAVATLVPVLPERLASGVYRFGRAKVDPQSEVIFHEDGKTASISMIRSPESVAILTNGKSDAAISSVPSRPNSDETTMVLTAMLPLAYRPEARTAAVIGLGSGLTTATLMGSPNLARVDTIEIEPEMVNGARLFGTIVDPAFDDPRSRIVIDDAKSYFARSNIRYDLLLSEPSNPWVSGTASLFTREFYARVKGQLTPGGIFVQWIQVYEFNDALLATILRALDAEFADYSVFAANDGDLIILASNEALPAGMRPDLIRWEGMRKLRERLRFTSVDELEARHLLGKRAIQPALAGFGEGMNSDYYPIVDQRAPKARFFLRKADGLMRIATAPVPIVEMLIGERNRASLTLDDAPIAPSARRAQFAAASGAAAHLTTGKSGPESPLVPKDIGVLAVVLWDCAPLPSQAGVADLLLKTAAVVNPVSDPKRAHEVWSAVRSAKCASRMGREDLKWIDLFDAVGARDAGRMASLGAERLAAPSVSDDAKAYALMAAVTGLLAQGDTPAAQRLLDDTLPNLSRRTRDDAPMRLLVNLARAGATLPRPR
jgi:predicted membrane-bound spermidine synthase